MSRVLQSLPCVLLAVLSGVASATSVAAAPKVLWKYKTGGVMRSDPQFNPKGDTVFIGDDDSNLYAITTGDGSLKVRAQCIALFSA
jgi:hypothetical protein